MSKTKIEWCDRVWNPVTGCSKISPGCANCYAERMSKRLAGRCGYPKDDPFKVTLHPERLDEPWHWKKPSRIFVCSMADLFHEDVPDEFIWDVFNTMSNTQFAFGHTFLVLTKRPERMLKIIKDIEADIMEQRQPLRNGDGITTRKLTFAFPLQNIWLGVTAENQEQADKRIPILLQIPAAKRFVSIEPMLGPVDVIRYIGGNTYRCGCGFHDTENELLMTGATEKNRYAICRECGKRCDILPAIDWVICGGESGPGARPMHPDWVRSLRDQCLGAGVPFLFKQWGEWEYQSEPVIEGHQIVKTSGFFRVGKKKAGRLLDGQLWDQYPEEKE